MLQQSQLKVAVAQFAPQLADLDANVETHRRWIRRAQGEGVELLLFPELSLTGYNLGERIIDVALDRYDSRLRELAHVAPELTVVLGFVEEGPAAQFYNAAIALHGGKIEFLHHKLNLPAYGNLEEAKWFASGSFIETFGTGRPWRVATLICADLWNPALVHLAMVHGATLLLAPINSALDAVGGQFSNPEGWDRTVRFYAMMYGMPVLMANRVGEELGARFWGGSQIIGPTGETLARAADEDDCLLIATLDYQHIRRARFQLPTLRDANLDLVHREVKRLADKVGIPTFMRDE